jgi:pimeloyl-ACP methyl ester carboxylesterase
MLRMYQVRRPARSTFVPLRNQRYHVRLWGQHQVDQPPLVMVHGWMDVSASYQFVIDAMAQDRFIIAPDWRGFGQTREMGANDNLSHWGHADHYWFADYLADLDFLLDHFNTELGREGAPFDLVGHSMGGNVSMIYAGVRPERIRRLVNLEGFGMPMTHPTQAARRYAHWINELKKRHRGELDLQSYDNADGVARRLMRTNPRLGADKAAWLAQHWAQPNAQGHWEILGDPGHKVVSAMLYRVDEAQEIFKCISAPVLAVEASDDSLAQWYTRGEHTLAQYHERLQAVPDCRIAEVSDAGHMLHHDQPADVARLIETHLA